jgi:rubrerythrin
MENLMTAMKGAIDMEKKGYDVYMNAAKKTKNILGRYTLEMIGKKELDHIKAIEVFMKALSEGSADFSRAVSEIKPKEKLDYYRPLMEELSKELGTKVGPEAELESAYEVAMELEKRSYDLYKRLEASSRNLEAKKFFQFLMKEENTHYEILQDTLRYLDNPGDWFREAERWIVEG